MKSKRVLKVVSVVALAVVVLGVGGVAWAGMSAQRLAARTFETHQASFPIPFPLTEAELAEEGLESDPGDEIALRRAVARGEHLVRARYGCTECHGQDFSGGVMVDAAPIGTFLGPNITTGEGSGIVGYTASDWDRLVRHGVKPDGTPAYMPSIDFLRMSDQELSDIVAYIRSRPPMFGDVAVPTLGPVGKVLVATGQLPFSADVIEDHRAPHETYPPAAAVSVEFGEHLAGVCVGCHGEALVGGVIPGGDPSWAPAANLTPHEDGLAGWSYEDFASALRETVGPDGAPLLAPMDMVAPYAQQMTETELRALWAYLQSVPALPDG